MYLSPAPGGFVEKIASNIVDFPKKKMSRKAKLSLEKLREENKKARLDFALGVVEEVTTDLFVQLNMVGFDFSDEIYQKDVVLVTEGIRSAVYKHMGEHHPMQEAAQKMIDIDDGSTEEEKST
jgi:hypothetical protein